MHREIRDTYDLDLQHRLPLGSRQEFMWGLGYRYTNDELGDGRDATGNFSFIPPERGDQLFSAFVQDEIKIVEDRLQLTLGTKFEHNDYTGFEIQPSARLLLTPHANHTFWGAVSRALRTPSRFEHTIEGWFGPAVLIRNEDFNTEQLLAYEVGYRWQATRQISFDTVAFYNEYEGLRSGELAGLRTVLPPPFPPFPAFRVANNLDGETYGAEFSANWSVTDSWRLSAGYTWLKMQLHARTFDISGDERAEGNNPEHQLHLRSYLDLPYNLQLDSAVYYVDSLPNRNVASYVRLDARLGWRPRRDLELSLGVQNILDDRHPEAGAGFLVQPTEVERSVYAKATWRF